MTDIETRIRQVLAKTAKLAVDANTIDKDSDLYLVGLSSLSTVNVMLAVEDAFDIEISDDLLSRNTFQTISNIVSVVENLTQTQAA